MRLTHKNPDLGSALGFMLDGHFDKLACIQDYDAGTPELKSGRRLIRFAGCTYEVVNLCEESDKERCAYHCRRIYYRGPANARAAYKARCDALLR